jgi:hypothetical protein
VVGGANRRPRRGGKHRQHDMTADISAQLTGQPNPAALAEAAGLSCSASTSPGQLCAKPAPGPGLSCCGDEVLDRRPVSSGPRSRGSARRPCAPASPRAITSRTSLACNRHGSGHHPRTAGARLAVPTARRSGPRRRPGARLDRRDRNSTRVDRRVDQPMARRGTSSPRAATRVGASSTCTTTAGGRCVTPPSTTGWASSGARCRTCGGGSTRNWTAPVCPGKECSPPSYA